MKKNTLVIISAVAFATLFVGSFIFVVANSGKKTVKPETKASVTIDPTVKMTISSTPISTPTAMPTITNKPTLVATIKATAIPTLTATPLPTLVPVTQKSTAIPTVKGNDYLKIGFDLIKNEKIGFLRVGISDTEVVNTFAEPEEKSKIGIWTADGLSHQTWFYKSKGIELNFTGTIGNQIINMIQIKNPCIFKTLRKIGIGSDREDVLTAYKNEIDSNEVNKNNTYLVAGSVYGGIIFNFENNKVSSIFVGASAE